jgi:predicted nucleotidyltransferase
MDNTGNILDNLIKFRSLMRLKVSKEKIKYIWGKKYLKSLDIKYLKNLKEDSNGNVATKVQVCKDNVGKLMVFNWVRFIGISGSVAAGFAKDEDDIDLFIVVRNGTVWLYRGIIVFLNLFHNKIRAKRHKDVKNKLCINLISEERGLQFENDIFNFHELMYLIPVYNERYINYIYSQNPWLEKEFFVKKENLISRESPRRKTFFLIGVLNYLAFLSQLLFMSIVGHRPDIETLRKNYNKGRIEFFEHDYREEVMKNYLKEFKSIN